MCIFGTVHLKRTSTQEVMGSNPSVGERFGRGMIPLKYKFLTPGKKGQPDPNTVAVATVKNKSRTRKLRIIKFHENLSESKASQRSLRASLSKILQFRGQKSDLPVGRLLIG